MVKIICDSCGAEDVPRQELAEFHYIEMKMNIQNPDAGPVPVQALKQLCKKCTDKALKALNSSKKAS